MSRTKTDFGFVAIRIEGGLLPSEFLNQVISLKAKHQNPADYRLPRGTTIKDEIGRAWRIATAEWKDYVERRDKDDVDLARLTDDWLGTLFRVVLNFDDFQRSSTVNLFERNFPITHIAWRGILPVVLSTHKYRIDKPDLAFGDEGRRRSQYGLMQEYLNASDQALWGMVSNGNVLRLLRDNPTLTRPAFIEVDLERIFDEQLYSDFAAFWLLFHGSRFNMPEAATKMCPIEQWKHEAQQTGERALAELRTGVTAALIELGNGFLQHNENTNLRAQLTKGEISAAEYFRQLLRIVYRLLFLFSAEERDVLHANEASNEARYIYRNGYSASRLRQLALKRRNYDSHSDLWQSLLITFSALATGSDPIALPALGGLFKTDHCTLFDSSKLQNQYLLRAIYELGFIRGGSVLARVNYRDMDTEELGSVYESLLELNPFIDVESSPWVFGFIDDIGSEKGSERKVSGSYYTPQALVDQLIESTLVPVIDRVKKEHREPRRGLLNLKILDPACGSGHFLLSAARRLAMEIVKLQPDADIDEEVRRRKALREVIQGCVYGVDKNPLAVELCSTALWIETVQAGKPLSFLEHRIRCGDSLVGIIDPKIMEKGIPEAAYEPVSDDDPQIARELKLRNKQARAGALQASIFDRNTLNTISNQHVHLSNMPEDSLDDVRLKEQLFTETLKGQYESAELLKADIFVAAFFANKSSNTLSQVPLTEDLLRLAEGVSLRKEVLDLVRKLASEHKFFHWYIEFSEVFSQGGFDVVLGNPPWERIKVQEQEFFSGRDKAIAEAKNKAIRQRLIEQLFRVDASPAEKILAVEFLDAKRSAEGTSSFVRNSGRFPLCGRGDINTYAVFAELFTHLMSSTGYAGFVVPSGIATDDTTKFFFQDVVRSRALASLYSFENEEFIFPGIHHATKFCLLTLSGKSVQQEQADFVFFARKMQDLQDDARHFSLSPSDLFLLNPNTGTCPTFRYKRDAVLVMGIYRKIPVLVKEGSPEENPWGIRIGRMFDMTNDAALFVDGNQIDQSILIGRDNQHLSPVPNQSPQLVPLYEAKMIHIFDHRFGTYEGQTDAQAKQGKLPELTESQHRNPNHFPLPRYWVASNDVIAKIGEKWKHPWFLAWRGIGRSVDVRTLIPCLTPFIAAGNSLHVSTLEHADDVLLLLGNLGSFILDYLVRFGVGGINLNFFIVKQVPVLPPTIYQQWSPWNEQVTLSDWISCRMSELVFTSNDLIEAADDLGLGTAPFNWDSARRSTIRNELDAAYFFLYGVARSDIEWVMDTFHVLRDRDEDAHTVFKTKNEILAIYDKLVKAQETKQPYESALEPPPGDDLARQFVQTAVI